MKEYRLAKGWTWAMYILTPPFLALFIWVLVLPFTNGAPNWSQFFILGPFGLSMMALFGFGLVETKKGKFIIEQDRVRTESLIGNRSLLLEEIKGYRTDDNYIYIEPIDKKKKRLKVSTYFEKKNEIFQWVAARYPDLTALAQQEEEEAILQDEELGKNVEEREQKLGSARTIVRALNIAGGVVIAWAFFWPQPYEYLLLTAILLFIVTLTIVKFNGKLMRLGFKNTDAYPSPIFAIIASASALGLRAMMDFEIYEYSAFWLPFLGLSALMLVAFLIGSKEFTFKKASDYWIILALFLFIAEYSYGSIIFLNCYYDKSEMEAYTATVEDKWVSSGKATTYYLRLSPWATRKESESVSVSSDFYDTVEPKQEVTVYLGKGEFGIPWFFVGE